MSKGWPGKMFVSQYVVDIKEDDLAQDRLMIRGPECFTSGEETGTGPLHPSLAAAFSQMNEVACAAADTCTV